MSDASELFRNCFKYLGHSINDDSPELIKQVEALLIKQKPNIKSFHEDNGQDLLLSGRGRRGDGVQRRHRPGHDRGRGHQFRRPQGRRHEAVRTRWRSRRARRIPRTRSSSSIIILDAKVGAEISTTIKYPSPNAAAVALMPDSYKNNPVIFPPAEIMAKCEYPSYLGADFTASSRRGDDTATRSLIGRR